MFCRKKKGVWEQAPRQPTQACWDHQALTSASSSKIYSDLPVFSSFLSVRRILTLGVSDLLLLTCLLFLLFWVVAFTKYFYVRLKEISDANVTTSVLYHIPKSASPERPRTRVAWRKIKPDSQKHPELQRHMKTNLTKKMIFRWGNLPKSRIMHIPIQIPPTLYFLHPH